MPPVQLNAKVNMSCVGSVAEAQSIGTEGLAMCVGVVATGTPESGQGVKNTCAHISCSIAGVKTDDGVRDVGMKTRAILSAHFDPKSSQWGYSTGTNDWTAKAIIAACVDFFKSTLPKQAATNATSLYLVDGVINADNKDLFGAAVTNEVAEIKP